MSYDVITRDVDGQTRRRYKTLKAARGRFERMVGHSMEAAIAEQFHAMPTPPLPEHVSYLRAVSAFGCVVTLELRQPLEHRL